jgi:hypothetical protein
MQGPILHFQDILVAKDTIILPSMPSDRISELKRTLQGGRPFVLKEDVTSVLSLPNVLGISKYNTNKRSMQPTLHLTLGVITDPNVEIQQATKPPAYHAKSLRLVFYRDRKLSDVIASDPLTFAMSGGKQLENRERIEEFFRRVCRAD